MPDKERNKTATEILQKVQKTLEYLFERWQDKKDHEDISEYQKPLLPILAEYGTTVKEMTKRPFGFTFVLDGVEYAVGCGKRRLTLTEKA